MGEVQTVCCAIAVLGLLGPRALIIFWGSSTRTAGTWYSAASCCRLSASSSCRGRRSCTSCSGRSAAWTPIGWIVVALAFVLDIGTYGGGAFGNRERIPNYTA